MDKKKIAKIVLIIIGVFIAMAIAEILIKNIGTAIQEFSEEKEAEKEQQEIYNSEDSVQARQIEKFVDDVYEALENKKYEVVYNLLSPTYKDCFFENNLENFKSFAQEKLFLGENHNIVECAKKFGNYRVLVGVTRDNVYKTQICTVEIIDENTYNIMFSNLTKLIKLTDTSKLTDNIKYELKYYYETSNSCAIALKVTNISDKDTTIEMSDVYLQTGDGGKYEGDVTGDFDIKANQSSEVKVVYDKMHYSLDSMIFTETQNGKNTEVCIRLNEIFEVNTE